MKQQVKGFGEFLTESTDDQRELKGMGFNPVLSGSDLEVAIVEITESPAVQAAYSALEQALYSEIERFFTENEFNQEELEELINGNLELIHPDPAMAILISKAFQESDQFWG